MVCLNRILIALLLANFLTGCSEERSSKKHRADATRVACVGDSISYGFGLKNRESDCYPGRLQEMLGEHFAVRNLALNGTTILKKGNHPYWQTPAYHETLEWLPELIIIELGTNDTKAINWEHKADLANDLTAMIQAFRELPSKPEIFVCLPPPAFPERFGIRESVINDELIPILVKTAEQANCPTIDLHTPLIGRRDLFPDKIHPNEQGSNEIAKLVYQAIISLSAPTSETLPAPNP